MMYRPPNPGDPERELELEQREQNLKRDITTPIPVFYIVASIAVVLILIVAILGVSVFHFW